MTSETSSRRNHYRRANPVGLLYMAVSFLWLLGLAPGRADQVEMRNGDRYLGRVLSLDTNALILQSEVVGTLRLPRGEVTTIQLGTRPAAKAQERSAAASSTNSLPVVTAASESSPEMAAALRQLATKTNVIRQIQRQFLSDAGPEANQQFDGMVSGLLSGKLTLSDLRAQARSMAGQLRAAQEELGSEAGWAVDGYLAVLDHFLKESEPAPATRTNTAKAEGGNRGR